MATPKKIKIEGLAEIEEPEIACICEFCNSSTRNPSVEFNFKEQKIFYFCPECKKMNLFQISKGFIPPMPKTRLTR